MRTASALSVLVALFALAGAASGCASATEEPAVLVYDSVRDRLAQPTRLLVTAEDSAASITARRGVGSSAEAGFVELAIENGEIIVATTRDDRLTLEGLQLSFSPVTLPPTLIEGHHAEISNLRVDLVDADERPAQWHGDDEVHVEADLVLQLSWQLSVDGAPAPLGSPVLPPVPVELVLTGDGAHVHAELRAHAPGALWSWAGLLELRDLTLVLGASL
jgi:hypothetical protein